ncbi:MAG: aldo/keto reductase [Anaerolineales bacterium]
MEFERVQGADIPKIGLGTWQLQGNPCYRAVLSALELGYRHLDTAEIYDNEAQVGRAIADSGVARPEIFLVTKVWTDHLAYSDVLRAARGSLKRLGVDQIDLYLVHWPRASMPIAETMQAMNELVEGGQIARVGVSNFSVGQLEAAQSASSVKLFTNQVAFAVGSVDAGMLDYCQQNDVLLTAYSPLDRGRLARSLALKAVGDRHGKTAAQVALRWCIQQAKVVAIPKSESPERQRENLELFDFELSKADLAELARL